MNFFIRPFKNFRNAIATCLFDNEFAYFPIEITRELLEIQLEAGHILNVVTSLKKVIDLARNETSPIVTTRLTVKF